MMNHHSLFPPFATLLQQALGDLLDPEATTLLEMMDENIVFEFPYASQGGINRVIGKDNLAQYLSEISALIDIESLSLSRCLLSTEGDSAVLEFTGSGMLKQCSQPYTQHYISVIDIKNQHITHYRDYWNPLAMMSTDSSNAMSEGTL